LSNKAAPIPPFTLKDLGHPILILANSEMKRNFLKLHSLPELVLRWNQDLYTPKTNILNPKMEVWKMIVRFEERFSGSMLVFGGVCCKQFEVAVDAGQLMHIS